MCGGLELMGGLLVWYGGVVGTGVQFGYLIGGLAWSSEGGEEE